MKNTNTKEFKNALKRYLVPIIEEKAEDYETTIEGNPFAWVVGIAKSEVPHEFERYGAQNALEYWLSGLGLSLDYTYADIITVSESLHGCKLTEKEQDLVCEKWFCFLAAKIIQFANGKEVTK